MKHMYLLAYSLTPDLHTMGTFDNFEHEDTDKTLISETSVVQGPRQFREQFPCQLLKDFIKPAKKTDLNEEFGVAKEHVSLDPVKYNEIEAKDMGG